MSEPSAGTVLDRVRRDAYTGENRCWPCTGVNLAILSAVAVAVGVLVSPPVAATVALVGAAAVWLRGYLVPYTPQLTARVRSSLPGDVGHAAPPRPPGAGSEAADESERSTDAGADTDDIVEALLAAGVLAEDRAGLSLAPPFHEAWRSEVEDGRPYDPERLASDLEAAVPWVADASVVTDDGRQWIRLTDADDSVLNETWLAPPAAAADLTAVRTLAARTDLGQDVRTLAASSLRGFLERCPVCDVPLEVSSPTACCGSPRYVAEGVESVLSCPDCDEVVATFDAVDEE